MCIETTKVRLFKSVKNVQIKHKKYGKGGHRNLSDHFETMSFQRLFSTIK